MPRHHWLALMLMAALPIGAAAQERCRDIGGRIEATRSLLVDNPNATTKGLQLRGRKITTASSQEAMPRGMADTRSVDAVMFSRGPVRSRLLRSRDHGRTLPVLAVLAALTFLWYAAAVWLNAPQILDRYARAKTPWTARQLVQDAWAMERPVLPAPHQVLVELRRTVLEVAPSSRRSLLYHGWVTFSSAMLGFVLGTALGCVLALGIVQVPTLDRSLMPWIIASQTIPILAIAPMIVVVLGSLGLTGLVPKALISTYLCFFPVAIGMVKGLRSPESLQLDLMRTYSASEAQVVRLLRVPASLPFLFASLKVAVAISVVGAIVGELPTGAQAGLGARLLTGSYYGQTVQIWAALVAASLLSGTLVALVGLAQRLSLRHGGSA